MTPKQRNFLRGLVVSIILAATAYTGANATDLTTDSAVAIALTGVTGIIALFVKTKSDEYEDYDDVEFEFDDDYEDAEKPAVVARRLYPDDRYYRDSNGIIRNTSDGTPNA